MTVRFTAVARRGVAATAVAAALSTAALPALADEALADLVEEVTPSVVTVLSERAAPAMPEGFERFSMPEGSPFEEFFREFGRRDGGREMFPRPGPRQGIGSGFVFDEDGLIVTNYHVIDGADIVTVRLSDNREFEAEVVGVDEQTDLALLRIEADSELPALELGDSDDLRVGEDVVAVGNPFGLGGTVTAGIVSAKGRNIGAGPYADFIQTDAAINRGNSGGPLLNMEGEVVGVNSAIFSPNGGSVGVGFAVTSAIVEDVVIDLLDDGEVERGWLGVAIQNVSPALGAALGLDRAEGALVSSVVPGSPADGTLQEGDLILGFNGEPVETSRDLPRLVGAADAGSDAELRILRDGEEMMLELELGSFQTAAAEAPSMGVEPSAYDAFGATVEPLTDEMRARLDLGEDVEGIVVTSLAPGGPAERAGLQVGDVIVRLGDAELTSTDALADALETEKTDPALLLINRDGSQLFVAVEVS